MAKAKLVLRSGAEVQIEGTAAEVAELLSSLEDAAEPHGVHKKGGSTKRSAASQAKRHAARSKGPKTYIEALKAEGFFSERRSLNQVQQELERNGHIYPVTHLSTPLLRLVKARELRRMKEGDQWVYVNP
jgi:hypothetical protein